LANNSSYINIKLKDTGFFDVCTEEIPTYAQFVE